MSIAQRLIRRAAKRVAESVARHDLFEKAGDRAPTPRLTPKIKPDSDPASSPTPPPQEGEAEQDVVVTGLDGLSTALGPGGGLRLVNHWATWCSGCVEELPELRRLYARVGQRVRFIGLSWDRFQAAGSMEDSQQEIRALMAKHDLPWSTLVLSDDVDPDGFFAHLEMTCQTVPQTWVVDDKGVVLERLEGVLGAEEVDALARRLEERG